MGSIYQIVNLVNGKRYIGSTSKLSRRYSDHFRLLKLKSHHAHALQNAWNKYGACNFRMDEIISCENEDLLMYEQLAFTTMKPEYNSAKIAGSTLGTKHTEAACANIKAAAIRRSATLEWSEKMKVVYINISEEERARRRVHLTNPILVAKSLEIRRTPRIRAVMSEKAAARAKKFNVFGELLTVLEASTKYGFSKALIKNRLKYMTLEAALVKPIDTKKSSVGADKFRYDGVLYSMQGLADHLGLSKTTVFRRARKGEYDIVSPV